MSISNLNEVDLFLVCYLGVAEHKSERKRSRMKFFASETRLSQDVVEN